MSASSCAADWCQTTGERNEAAGYSRSDCFSPGSCPSRRRRQTTSNEHVRVIDGLAHAPQPHDRGGGWKPDHPVTAASLCAQIQGQAHRRPGQVPNARYGITYHLRWLRLTPKSGRYLRRRRIARQGVEALRELYVFRRTTIFRLRQSREHILAASWTSGAGRSVARIFAHRQSRDLSGSHGTNMGRDRQRRREDKGLPSTSTVAEQQRHASAALEGRLGLAAHDSPSLPTDLPQERSSALQSARHTHYGSRVEQLRSPPKPSMRAAPPSPIPSSRALSATRSVS